MSSEPRDLGGSTPLLFTPLRLRDLTLGNRIAISPMCQHAAQDGCATDWHLVHLGKFALGGAGLILTESTAVSPYARIGVKDLGLWCDEQIEPLRRVVDFVHEQGAAIGVQLAHAGRKAGSRALWDGGQAFTERELAESGVRRVGPSAIPAGPEWSAPEALGEGGIADVVTEFVAAARRAEAAGFDAVELHFGHGISSRASSRGSRTGATTPMAGVVPTACASRSKLRSRSARPGRPPARSSAACRPSTAPKAAGILRTRSSSPAPSPSAAST